MSASESWEVNGYNTRCSSPVSVVVSGVRLAGEAGWLEEGGGANETEIGAARCAMWLKKDFTFSLCHTILVYILSVSVFFILSVFVTNKRTYTVICWYPRHCLVWFYLWVIFVNFIL